MTDADLHVEVQGDEITISLPGSRYSVTYFKPEYQTGLLARRISERKDPLVAMGVQEFLAQAWKLANDKARELGWIV